LCKKQKEEEKKKFYLCFLSSFTTQLKHIPLYHLHSSCALQLIGDGGDHGGETKHNQKKRKERGKEEWKIVH
jgi:hypothetical protein